MASNLTVEVKELQDVLVLFAGVYFLVGGIEIAADPVRVKYPPDTIKMVAHFLMSMFLIGFWFSVLSGSGNKNSYNVL
jgi:hypothetical protein